MAMATTFRPWTPEEDVVLQKLLGEGLSATKIGNEMGRHESSVNRRIERLETEGRKRTRNCMCCGTAFKSDGPHNRLCGRCRSIETTPFHR